MTRQAIYTKLRKPLVAQVVLAVAVAYAIADNKNNATHQTAAVAASTRQVLQDNCVRGNGVRAAVRSILQGEIPQIHAQAKRFHLSPADQVAQIRIIRADLAKVPLTDCTNAGASIHK